MGRRSGRAAARRAAAALESTPKSFDPAVDEDEAMQDADPVEPEEEEKEEKPKPEPEPESEPEPEQEPDAEPDADEEEAAPEESGDEPADKEEESAESAKEPTPPPEPVIRRRRVGRPLRTALQTGTRQLRRLKEIAMPLQGDAAVATIDREGTVVDIADDECVLPEDPEGETKVDKLGNLHGGRDYRCRTFTVLGRGNRLYMLSTEPARCVGFRDSYLFFTKHLKLHKIIVDDDEKRDMIDREIIPHSYKGRAIGIVTARSVFREFGARMIVGGRRIVDDYEVAKARAEGAVEGEIADPTDRFIEGEPYNKNQYVAWHGASAVYHQSAPAVQAPIGKPDIKKRRVNVNDTNWMLEHARDASLFNSTLTAVRLGQVSGVYEIHTNMMHYPAMMQPTHAKFEQQPLANEESTPTESKHFPPLPSRVARNFQVLDVHMEMPPAGISTAAYGKTVTAEFLNPFRGLGAVSDDIKDLLPQSVELRLMRPTHKRSSGYRGSEPKLKTVAAAYLSWTRLCQVRTFCMCQLLRRTSKMAREQQSEPHSVVKTSFTMESNPVKHQVFGVANGKNEVANAGEE
ncbi:unnamed protein product [Parascedosporium putredinis]|uniref:Chromatin structure-remodeling complex protein RSC7 n=1 Tax=Parascedosporium putredinis TaxID=1442378 RepID=A0A9P1H6P8_9PEZI|nr:unnamed protein product [Parascedosporium putredinis]CAI7997739.1 unnamed protein product [Parascedosporium putredinis]